MIEQNHHALLVTAGKGPAECSQAVGHILARMQAEAALAGLSLSVHRGEGEHGPVSAVVVAHGSGAARFAADWVGTIRWRMQSQIRRHHKRSNWFVGVFALEPQAEGDVRIAKADVVFSTLRAGGPGGQHQNTTDSAVRAVHSPTGLTVTVRDGRSQHRNKALALERLQSLADAQGAAAAEARKSGLHKMHHALERGNPVRKFTVADFREES